MKKNNKHILSLLLVLFLSACLSANDETTDLPSTLIAEPIETAVPHPIPLATATLMETAASQSPPLVIATVVETAVPQSIPLATATLTETAVPTEVAAVNLTPVATAVEDVVVNPGTMVVGDTNGMKIDSFMVTAVDLPDNGKRLTFSWATSGGVSATILSGSAQRFQPYWDVPLSGELTVDLALTLFRDPAMTLKLSNAAGDFIVEPVVVPWNCAHDYYFAPAPQRCPQPQVIVSAAMQAFEYGLMVWLDNVDGNGVQEIVVLYDDGAMQRFTDTWLEGDPVDDSNLTPPAGLLQPVRGFGKVWRDQSGVRNRLGWAFSLEQSFQATVQKERAESIPTSGYLQLVDGRIIHMPFSVPFGTWQQIN